MSRSILFVLSLASGTQPACADLTDRGIMCDGPKDKCSNCGKEWSWDACQDTYCGAKSIPQTAIGQGILIEAFLCDCEPGIVFAVYVLDGKGGDVYVPSKQEI